MRANIGGIRHGAASLLVTAVALGVAGQGRAADTPPGTPSDDRASRDWQGSVGAAAVSFPRYPGSDRQRTLVVPSFEVRYRDWFFIDPVKGIGFRNTIADGLTLSTSLALDLASRRAEDAPRLIGFRDIGETFALRLGVEYELGPAFVNAALLSRLGREYRRGTSLETDAGWNVVASEAGVYGVGVNLRAMDDTYARNFFGVDDRQASTASLRRFDASGGLLSAGVFAQAFVRWPSGGVHSVACSSRGCRGTPRTARSSTGVRRRS